MVIKKILVLFSGSGTNLENLIHTFKNSKEISVAHALTNNKEAEGIHVALKNGVPCTIISSKDHTKKEYEALLLEKLHHLEYDLIVLAGYMKLVSQKFLQTAKSKVINIHPSLLPRHKGLYAIKRSFEDECTQGGVTIHFVNDKMDDGEIILQQSIQKQGLDFTAYLDEIKKVEFTLLPRAIMQTLELE